MIPIDDDTYYCLILDHHRFQQDPLTKVFQNEERPELVRLFNDTLLEDVAEEGPWCLLLSPESAFIAGQLLTELWQHNPHWQGGATLVVGLPEQPKQALLQWIRSRALALSAEGNLSIFRFYSPALLHKLADNTSQQEQEQLLAGIKSLIWSTGQLQTDRLSTHLSTEERSIDTYRLPETLQKGLMA